ncbi:hypothetical protein B0H67DRAFT_646147 [Lasiosphaeris hirsuta]|uniref:Uncharacterized protein n=1 Tax=Lasiosphaeris hirsuta TaxID=260670 RepID=A0AA40A7R5_9PEZI|nr:hypothetical protein B0H67DRAFT_646147 [Lasiosphaeris hirsuta]
MLFRTAFCAGLAALAAALLSPPPSEETIVPGLAARATSFKCPVYPNEPPAQTCTDRDIFWDNRSVSGKSVTFYFTPNDPVISAASAANRTAARELIEGAMNRALDYYQNWAVGLKIYFGVVGKLEKVSGKTLSATTGSPPKVTHCDILMVYPDSTTNPIMRLRMLKVVAHELYHCIQFGANIAGMPSEADNGEWWSEGSARYFDGVLYPPPPSGAPTSLLDMSKFAEEYNPRRSLVQQEYEAALYYHYLQQVGVSPGAINAWVLAKTARRTAADDMRDAARTPLLADHWHGFAEAFVDNRINYTASNPIRLTNPLPNPPGTIAVPALSVGSSWSSGPVAVDAFMFNQTRFAFPTQTDHRVTLPKGTGFKCSFRQAGATVWKGAGDVSFTVKNSRTARLLVDILCSCNGAVACSGSITVARI